MTPCVISAYPAPWKVKVSSPHPMGPVVMSGPGVRAIAGGPVGTVADGELVAGAGPEDAGLEGLDAVDGPDALGAAVAPPVTAAPEEPSLQPASARVPSTPETTARRL